MADTRYTTAGGIPAVLNTTPDGNLPDLGGRRAWVRVQHGTGRFDVRSDRVDWWRSRGAVVVPNHPINFGPSARDPEVVTAPVPAAGAGEQADTTTKKGGRTQ